MKFKKNSIVSNIGRDLGNGISSLVKQSTQAVCGTFEREIIVPNEKVAATKAKLRASGKMIVGTSEPGGRTRTIWFVDRGLASL